MPSGNDSGLEIGYSVKIPAGVILPILFLSSSVNHTLPSGPRVMPDAYDAAVGMGVFVKET